MCLNYFWYWFTFKDGDVLDFLDQIMPSFNSADLSYFDIEGNRKKG